MTDRANDIDVTDQVGIDWHNLDDSLIVLYHCKCGADGEIIVPGDRDNPAHCETCGAALYAWCGLKIFEVRDAPD